MQCLLRQWRFPRFTVSRTISHVSYESHRKNFGFMQRHFTGIFLFTNLNSKYCSIFLHTGAITGNNDIYEYGENDCSLLFQKINFAYNNGMSVLMLATDAVTLSRLRRIRKVSACSTTIVKEKLPSSAELLLSYRLCCLTSSHTLSTL